MEVRAYDSMEAMHAAMAEAEETAMRGLHDLQRKMIPDDTTVWWVSPTREVGLVFGEAWTWRRQIASAMKYVTGFTEDTAKQWSEQPEITDALAAGKALDSLDPAEFGIKPEDRAEWWETVQEAAYGIRATAEARARGYMFGKAWSHPYPQGELGDTHVASAWPITEAAFEEARATGWRAVATPQFDDDQDDLAREAGGTPTLVRELVVLQELVDAHHAQSEG